MKNILAFSGSARILSLNGHLLGKAAEMARQCGAVVEIIDLRAPLERLQRQKCRTHLRIARPFGWVTQPDL